MQTGPKLVYKGCPYFRCLTHGHCWLYTTLLTTWLYDKLWLWCVRNLATLIDYSVLTPVTCDGCWSIAKWDSSSNDMSSCSSSSCKCTVCCSCESISGVSWGLRGLELHCNCDAFCLCLALSRCLSYFDLNEKSRSQILQWNGSIIILTMNWVMQINSYLLLVAIFPLGAVVSTWRRQKEMAQDSLQDSGQPSDSSSKSERVSQWCL